MTRPVTVKKSDMTRVEDAAIRLALKAEEAGIRNFTAEVTQEGEARIIMESKAKQIKRGPKPW